MKKILLMLIPILLMPVVVNADSTINTSFDDENCILTVSGNQTGHDATVSMFNSDNELIGFKTGEIDNNSYSVDFTLVYDSEQNISITLSNEGGTNEFSENNISVPACVKNEEENPNNEEEYEVFDAAGDSISFSEEPGHTFTLTISDFVGLTDEEIELMEFTRELYEQYFSEIINATKENGTLISFFKIEVKDENNHNITDGPFNIKIKLIDEMKKYDTFKMIFVDVDNGFVTEDPITFTVNGDYLEGTLNHLSTYALVGTKTSNTGSNPNTSDKIMYDVKLLGLSIIGLFGAGLYLNKKRKRINN